MNVRRNNRQMGPFAGPRSRFIAIVLAACVVAAGLATAVTQSSADPVAWQGEYFANPTLTGTPALTRTDAGIEFDWGAGSPDPVIPIDGFSVRWTATLDVTASVYRFSTITDDGVRLYVDGALLIDHWVDQGPTEWQGDIDLAAGPHIVVMEYYENAFDAVARLSYAPVQVPGGGGGWQGEYFANKNLQNQPLVTKNDPVIDFNWGLGSPGFGLPSDNFSVRWTRTMSMSAGTYHLSTTTDDGVRVKIDGAVVIDNWVDQSLTSNELDVPLTAGDHTFVVEYFDGVGTAIARFSWARRPEEGTVRINAGGGSFADSQNEFWDADHSFTGGVTSEETQPIWNTTDDALYVNERAGAFSYDIPLTNRDYVVRLHFAELYFNSPGVRRFNVSIEGVPQLSSFDIYDTAGKASLVTRSFPVTLTDGTLNIAFSKVFDNAAVQAIDVFPAGTTDGNAPVFSAIPEPQNATYSTPPTLTLGVVDDVALADGYWRVDDQAPQSLFEDNGTTSFSGQFTLPLETFNNLSLGSHTLSFGANDDAGNAWTAKWKFRKLLSGGGSVPIAFNRRVLISPTTPGASLLKHPTTIQFGPDGKLYVGQQNGYIHVLTLDANRNVTNVTRIDTIFNTPNVNPDGSPAPTVQGRHLIGLDFDPASTPEQPIIWTVHSDPRFCFNKTPETCAVNTNSGILTRLTGPSFDVPANRSDFVTGLPRSRENHSPNAVHFGPDGWLYMAIGSNTNYGAPSTAFSFLPEVYLTAAFVRFNVNAQASAFPMDVRNVTGPSGLVPGAFELYATGYRNPYDFLWHSNGRMYANVNAGNFTAGNTPGPEHGCSNGFSHDPGTTDDYLALVNQGDYGGNPNPLRQECILDDGTNYPTPLTPEPNYHAPLLRYFNGTSSNGMFEYRSPTFGGQLLGNIISATFAGSQSVRRVVLSADGTSVAFEEDLAIFNQPLDVTVGSEGSIYVAEYGANDIQIMEPAPPLEGTWDIQTPLPVPTQEMGVVGCANKAYVIGGLTAPSVDTNNVWVYDPGTRAWTAAAPYPGAAVDHPGVACVNGKVYMFGGLVAVGPAVKTVYEYDPATNVWTQKADMPAARGAMGVATIGSKAYVAGGLGYPAKADLYSFDPATNTWQTLAPMPTARDHFVLEAVGGKLYAIGGRNVTLSSVTAVNEMYDPATNTWATRAPMPIARAAMAGATLNDHIQIWGGEGPSGTPSGTYPQGHDYDPRTDTWNNIAGEPTPRHGTDAATINLFCYLPGGGPQTGNSVSDVNEVFAFVSGEPPSSCIQPGQDPVTTDSDGDGYMNQDELDNNSDPCSSASIPPDNDGDLVSDRNDPDDDNDGILDVADQFQRDGANGTATTLPWTQEWNPGDPPAGKFANSGFPGVQLTTNGLGYIDGKVHTGGAGGFLSLNATGGTNEAAIDSQDDALQVGFDATDPVTVSAQLADPLSGQVIEPGKAGGIFVGRDEDTYVKLVLASDNGTGNPGLVFAVETAGAYSPNPSITPVSLTLAGLTSLDLYLELDPAGSGVVARYRVNSDAAGDIQTLGSISAADFPGLANLFQPSTAAGILATNGASSSFGLAYNRFRIEEGISAPTTSLAVQLTTAPAGDPGRFDLIVDGTAAASSVGDGATTGPVTVTPGVHSVALGAAAGTSLADYSIAIGGACSASGAVTVASGQNASCTITATKLATINVDKVTVPSPDPSATSFSFNAGGGLAPSAFSLQDGERQTFAGVTPGAGYSVAENVSSGWSQTAATCSDGSPPSNIDLSPGEVVTCTFTNTRTAPPIVAILSLDSDTTLNGGTFPAKDEDVLSFDGAAYKIVIDGSDVGLGGSGVDVDAVEQIGTNLFLMSFGGSVSNLPGLSGTVDDSDVVLFTSTSLGDVTAGTFSMYFDGSDVGLTTDNEDVDAIELLPDNSLVVSVLGGVTVPGVSGADEDLLRFVPSAYGDTTAGTWSMYFDGSDVGLTDSNEDIDGVMISPTGDIYLSTTGSFAVTGVSGADEDVFICKTPTTGTNTSCTFQPTLFIDGSVVGLGSTDVDGVGLPPI